MRLRIPRAALPLAAAALLAGTGAPAQGAESGPRPPVNPYAAPTGTNGMHGDSASSDTTPYPGPGTGPVSSRRTALASACPTLTVGSDGYVVALCTTIFGRTPTVHLIDPRTGDDLASLGLAEGNLFGGVYAYLDNADRLVVADGTNTLLRIGHHRQADGSWRLSADERTPLGLAPGDGVVGLSPGWSGRVWFATDAGTTGTVDTSTGEVRTLAFPAGERVANSISTVEGRTAVATDHALYLLAEHPDGSPYVVWRRAYDRGSARKPGQLSWGTGATPVFFGPRHGDEYLTITDNADGKENLLVYREDGSEVCRVPAVNGTEDAVIASGRSVFVTSTYGYPYPALPANAGDSKPASASFGGGMTRIDVNEDGQGCSVVWENGVKSAALPRLSLGDGKIYTVTVSGPTGLAGLNTFAAYHYAVLDPATGKVDTTSRLGIGLLFNPLQMTGTTGPDGTFYQGTETGVVAVRRAP
ncbi:hypothetical protein ACWGDE_25450 [Streptomyces sp. NPDC054956]